MHCIRRFPFAETKPYSYYPDVKRNMEDLEREVTQIVPRALKVVCVTLMVPTVPSSYLKCMKSLIFTDMLYKFFHES
jgi:hypothetical protein